MSKAGGSPRCIQCGKEMLYHTETVAPCECVKSGVYWICSCGFMWLGVEERKA
jgi:hypothetical protein